MVDFQRHTSERLLLTRPTTADTAELFALNSDPRVWQHFPQGKHDELAQSAAVIDTANAGWEANGLDYWCVRIAADGPDSPVVAIGGCSLRQNLAWNLYYRLSPEIQGHGYAQELIAASLAAAAEVHADLPTVAYLLEHNTASRRAAERAGFSLAWSGPDADISPEVTRLVFSNRQLSASALEVFTK